MSVVKTGAAVFRPPVDLLGLHMHGYSLETNDSASCPGRRRFNVLERPCKRPEGPGPSNVQLLSARASDDVSIFNPCKSLDFNSYEGMLQERSDESRVILARSGPHRPQLLCSALNERPRSMRV